ncbi:MAG: DEAD/DEAH box helicase [Chloroflexota bacterium]|nr:DEAD/DEAH box helicase [Chloroflexota bacterium]
MMLRAWLHKLKVLNLGRNWRHQEGSRAVIREAPAPYTSGFPLYQPSEIQPEPVAWLPAAPMTAAEAVRTFIFDGPAPSAVGAATQAGASSTTGQSRRRSVPSPESLIFRLRRALKSPHLPLLPPPVLDSDSRPGLMPFQEEGVQVLLESDRILLADDMGLGKTLQVIVALRVLFLGGEIQSALVVAPASVLDQWRRELLKWAPDLTAMIVRGSAADRRWQWDTPVHVTLVSYDTLRSDFGGSPSSALGRKTWDVVVSDEAQRIKNRNSTSDAVKGLKRRRSWALTGTPVENDEEELASIMEFVDHGEAESPRRYSAGPVLRKRHRELQLRRRKEEVLEDLPPKMVAKIPVELGASQRRSYDRAEQEGIVHLTELGREVRVQHVLELITRLKQICNAEPETGESAKFEEIRGRIETLAAEGNRALVFSQYRASGFGVEAVADALRDFRPLTFTGAQSPEERRDVIDRFRGNDEHKVLVVSLRAGGVGLNLQEASYVFHLDRWWNPAVERQAEDRSHRFGQTVPVHVFKYSCVNTIEERIDRILERKQELFDELVDDVSIDLSSVLTARELFGLFGLEAPSGAGRG